MTVGKIENALERGFVKHCLNCLLITDPISLERTCDVIFFLASEKENPSFPKKSRTYDLSTRSEALH